MHPNGVSNMTAVKNLQCFVEDVKVTYTHNAVFGVK